MCSTDLLLSTARSQPQLPLSRLATAEGRGGAHLQDDHRRFVPLAKKHHDDIRGANGEVMLYTTTEGLHVMYLDLANM